MSARTRDLAAQIKPARPSMTTVEVRQAVVVATHAGPPRTATLRLAGSDVNVPGVLSLSWYRPTTGDTVWVLRSGPSPIILGPLGGNGLPGGGTGITVHGDLDGLGADDHPQYLTAGRGDVRYDPRGTAAGAVSSHTAAPDPHPQYLTEPDGDGRYLRTAINRLDYRVGGLYSAPGGPQGTYVMTPLRVTCHPVFVHQAVRVSRLRVKVTVGGETGSTLIGAIYGDTNGAPLNVVAGASSAPTAADVVGVRDLNFAAEVTLTPGIYWLGLAYVASSAGAPAVTLTGVNPLGFGMSMNNTTMDANAGITKGAALEPSDTVVPSVFSAPWGYVTTAPLIAFTRGS